ncbi:MAG: Eco57I restriction-modification methylase domain-containing protein [Candidatus Hodarchaeales archaeon]
MVTTQREKGQYFTPNNVAQAIVERVSAYLDKFIDNDTLFVLDPSVGEGIFCKALIQLLTVKYNSIHIDALDIDPSALLKAEIVVNNTMNDNKPFVTFYLKNYLTEFDIEDNAKRYELIISNPPHNAKYSPHQWDKIRNINHPDSQRNIPPESALYFFFKSLNLLQEGGILSFILPKPFIYSNKWRIFRKICLTELRILEVYDLANQFSGQLQEQVAIILQKTSPAHEYKTGFWNTNLDKFDPVYITETKKAINFDNFLVGITSSEQSLLENLLSNHKRMDWNAFRGLSSEFRTKKGSTPLIEKITLTHGFLLPERNYVDKNTPDSKLKRFLQPKIIAQRIIAYKTKPTFNLNLPVMVDPLGDHITHETIINIIIPKSSSTYIYSYGALFQSRLVSWWLQHAVYTKRFVTSKDLDKPYLNKIVIPLIDDKSNSDFRKQVKILIEYEELDKLSLITAKESKIDLFYSIGEIYKYYLKEGKKISIFLDKIIVQSNKKNENRKSIFKLMKQLDRFFRTKNIYEIKWLNTNLGLNVDKTIVEEIFNKYAKMTRVRSSIDEIVFKLYGLSQKEKRLIKQGELMQ